MSDTTPTTETEASKHNTHVPTDDEMSDAEFWQRLALEAAVNDDHAMAFAMRVESFFDRAWAFPNDDGSCVVHGMSFRGISEWLMSIDFEHDQLETTDDGNVVVTGLTYEPDWFDDFDA